MLASLQLFVQRDHDVNHREAAVQLCVLMGEIQGIALTVIGRAAKSMHIAHLRESSSRSCWSFPASFSWLAAACSLGAATAPPAVSCCCDTCRVLRCDKFVVHTVCSSVSICSCGFRCPPAAHHLLTSSGLLTLCQVWILLYGQDPLDQGIVIHRKAVLDSLAQETMEMDQSE